MERFLQVVESPDELAPGSSSLAGILLLGMTLSAILLLVAPTVPRWIAGALAWMALVLLWPRLVFAQRLQMALLLGAGTTCALWALARGVAPDPVALVSTNVNLLALLAGVSYLRLVTLPDAGKTELRPQGRMAFLRTLVGTHLFSAVINLSALLIVADRLADRHRLRRNTAIPLMRSFSAAAFWSPFFAAMGVALTYAPGASVSRLILHGIPLALLALAYTFVECLLHDEHRLAHYPGYPLHYSTLWIPAVLVTGVLIVHHIQPSLSVLLVVAALSLLLMFAVNLVRQPGAALGKLRTYTCHGLPRMSGELALFLSAGVMAAGLNALLQSFDNLLPLTSFGFTAIVAILWFTVGLSIIGIHPVISIASLGVGLAPLQPEPNILGTLFLCVWAIGVVAAPLSGMNLALHSRFGLQWRDIISWQYRYVLFMLVMASALLGLYVGQW